uniref:Protein kinase domain-containing protein n=1 Tax=Triticum aestivum TaxID=4565 RepID=A0A077RTV4_WHEAT|nr:unnamed protein product [Triticum aestivum]
MDPPEKQPPAAAASTASPSRGSAGAPPPLGRQHPQPSPDPDSVAATWEVGTSTTTTTPESIFAMESVRAMENKSCPQSDGPVKLSFKLLKEITNNFNHKLGFGASAEVYKGEFNGEVIAVKVLPFKIGVDEMLFQNEYEHLKRLKHPNIVRLVGFCDETERVRAEYKGEMVMAEEIHRALCLEFLPNGPLSNNLHEKHLRLDWHRRFQIIKGMCAGLEYIHGACVVHLDIKTDNVLLDAKMIPKIVDFGISRLLGEECIRESNATQLGTVGYVPPEFIDNRVISRGFDIFSVGVTIKKLLTGGMNYWNISYMNDKDCIEHVHNNWRKKFQEIPSYPSLEVDCEQVRTCIRTALQCMDDERLNRPSMKDINSELIERQMMTACSKECSESVQFPAKSRVRRKAFRKVQREATPLLREKTVRLKRNSWALDIQGKRGPISRRRERNYMCSDLKDDSRLTIDIPEMPSPVFKVLLSLFLSQPYLIFTAMYLLTSEVKQGILNSGEETLVKRFQGSKISYNVFQSEVGQLMEIKHKNIVRLLGYCNVKKREVVKHDGRYILTSKVESFLWYEYLSNKSLDEYIYGDSCQFDWNMRFKIILAICEALHFLHIELNRPISHLPLTPENIFLDKNMVPKLADIGLSDLFDGLSLEGTEYDLEINRYKAPEYINRYTTSFQSDIYNLGLLIMDTATGEKHSSCQETMDSSHFVNLKVCLHTALWCVKEKRKDRPSIREIVSTLNIPYLDTPLNKEKRAKRSLTRLPAAASVAPLLRGPLARRRGLSCRIRRADLYSCSLGIAYVARCGLAVCLSLMAMAATFNKCAPDLLTSSRFPVWVVSDLRARCPSGVVAAAAATSARLLSSNSADVVAFAPMPPRSSGGTVQECGRRASPACSRCWGFLCLVRGCRWAVLLFYVDMVDWIERCGGPVKLGVFPGRRSPKEVFSPPMAGSMRGPQSSLSARKLAGSRFCGVSSPSPTASSAAAARGDERWSFCGGVSKVLFVIFFMGSFLQSVETAGASGAFWLGLRVSFIACSARLLFSLYAKDVVLVLRPLVDEAEATLELLSIFGVSSGMHYDWTKKSISLNRYVGLELALIMDPLRIPLALFQPGAGPILLLSVQPQRLSFPLIPARLTSRPLCLTNNKDECVGFRLLTDNPARYHTELPLCGFVPPKCTYTINVIVREHTKELPSNSDEFLTLLTIRMQESDFKNLDPDSVAVLFENADHEVREMMLPVVCDPPEETTADQCEVQDVDDQPKGYYLHLELPEDVYSAKFIAQEQWLVTGDGDGYIHVYNYGRMEEVRNFKAHENNIMSMAIWNIKYDNCKRKFNEHPDGLLCLQYFADVQPNSRRHLLVVGSSDGVAKVLYFLSMVYTSDYRLYSCEGALSKNSCEGGSGRV